MTVEQYCELPKTEPFYYELRRGELVQVSRPKLGQVRIQYRLRQALDASLDPNGFVMTGLTFRPLPEYEVRVAPVAYVTRARIASADLDDYLRGAPDLVIEVLSPSDTANEINEKTALCLENGCREFWVVDPSLRIVKVSTPGGLTRTYRSGESIPLVFADNRTLPVDSIFAD